LAAHVLGYVDIDEKGLGGLEYRYNGNIRGDAGRLVVMTDARGRRFDSIEQPVAPGANLITTIDQNIQYIVEKEIADTAEKTRATGISIVVMDPRSGEILAMGNYPTFNPNAYAKYKPQAWINRAVSHVYEPGSTFKIVTALSAFEEGLTNLDEVIDCQNGSITVFGRLIRDWKPFGLLSVRQIMENSSDVGMIKLAMRVGDDRFADYIARMGFGKVTNVDLPGEEQGLSKPASRWTKNSVGSIAMGQEIGVTPLQVVQMVSVVANGGILYQPYVVKTVQHHDKGILNEIEPHGERVISAETAAKLQDMLESVVMAGTGKAGKLDGYTAAGKTGTAQKIDETGRYSATKHVASFTGFAPVANPAISMIVMVDEPVGRYHGGDVAAPIFKRVAEQILRYMSVPPDVPAYAPQYVVKPPKVERRVKQAAGSTQLVAMQQGDAGSNSESFGFGDIAVPDFFGKSLRQVTEETFKAGLRLQSIGSGAAVEQFPPAGANVLAGTRIQVRFSSRVER
jgi:cell division protein FtsI (penicillin-binding protein 3)